MFVVRVFLCVEHVEAVLKNNRKRPGACRIRTQELSAGKWARLMASQITKTGQNVLSFNSIFLGVWVVD